MGMPVRQKGGNFMAFEARTAAGAAKGQRKPESKKPNLESWAKCCAPGMGAILKVEVLP